MRLWPVIAAAERITAAGAVGMKENLAGSACERLCQLVSMRHISLRNNDMTLMSFD